MTVIAEDSARAGSGADWVRGAGTGVGPAPRYFGSSQRDEGFRAGAPIDTLVNNAGLERLTPVAATDDATAAIFERILDVNVKGSYWLPGGAAEDQGWRRIISLRRSGARAPKREFSAYCVEAPVIAWCAPWPKSLVVGKSPSMRYAPAGRTEVLDAFAQDHVRALPSSRGRLAGGHRRRTGAGRLMTPADIAGPIFLASPLAANITSRAINIDRGEG